MQRNTSIAARALVRITCRHVGAGVDTARYLLAERREKKEEPRGDGGRTLYVVKESVESSRCWSPPPFLQPPPFSRVFICSRVSLFLSSHFFYQALLHISLSSTFCLSSSYSQETPAISPVISWRRVHTSRVKYTESDFQFDAKPEDLHVIFFFFFYRCCKREKPTFANSDIKLLDRIKEMSLLI